MSVISKTRKYTRAGTSPLMGPTLNVDAAIVAAIRQHGSLMGIELLALVPGTPREVVDRLQELVARDLVRHGPDRRFSLRVAS